MARTTATEVKQILNTDLSDAIVDAFITSANELVSEVFATDTSLGTGLKSEIERWLTAHLIASTREQQLSEAGASTAKAKFQGKTGMGLQSTFYGQTVMTLDASGRFSALGGKSATIKAIESFD